MICPECGASTMVEYTRQLPGNNRRGRVCRCCCHRFQTVEIVQSQAKTQARPRKEKGDDK
jgi:transcriptional regulator NrdR family protein